MSLPLAGKCIVNTRAAHQAVELDQLLRNAGARPIAYPCIAIAAPEDHHKFDDALVALATGLFDWLIVTSVNTVTAVAERLSALDLLLSSAPVKVAAVGPTTADAVRDTLRQDVSFIPPSYTAETLAHTLPVSEAARILLPESAIARPALADLLIARGAQVTVVTAYRTVCATSGGDDVPNLLATGQVDALTFTSSSTVDCFVQRVAPAGLLGDAHGVCAACIGPQTAKTARDAGFASIAVAQSHTMSGLIDVLSDYFRQSVVSGDHS